jgi:hypothetical protein
VIEIDQDTISSLVEKLLDIELRINQEAGSLVLFALIERDDAPGKWDLVVSAVWAKERHKDLLNRIALHVRNNLRWEERVLLSRILILDPQDPFVRAINNMFKDVDHGRDRFSNFLVNGIAIKDSYIITSHRPKGL